MSRVKEWSLASLTPGTVHLRLLSKRSASTFCAFVREFSPLEVCAGQSKNVLLGWLREPGDGFGSRSLVRARAPRSRANSVSTMASAALLSKLAQLAIDTSNSHVGHDVARFTSIRDWRAAFLPASSSSGIGLPVPKYISSGV